MPDTQISEQMVRAAAETMKQRRRDTVEGRAPHATYEELARAALQAALSGHVVGWRTNLADWIDYADKLEAALKLVAGFSDDELKRIQAQDGLTIVRPAPQMEG